MPTDPPSPPGLAAVQQDINELLNDHYQKQRHTSRQISPNYERLWQAAEQQHQAGGKRLRPYFCILLYSALGGSDYQKVLPVAAALELLHSGMLAHDDIIDRDYVRRGQPNISGQYQNHYRNTASDGELVHYGDAAALLGGDILLSDAYQMVLQSVIPDITKLQVIGLLGQAVFDVIGGELLDLEAVLQPIEAADSLNIAKHKTAGYSFSIPLLIGATMAGTVKSDVITGYGAKLGTAFQLADDLLGVFGNENSTGKTILGDLHERKRTYLLQQTITLSTAEQQDRVKSILADTAATNQDYEAVREIMLQCGAKAAVEAKITDYLDEADRLLDQVQLPLGYKAAFTDITDKLIRRLA